MAVSRSRVSRRTFLGLSAAAAATAAFPASLKYADASPASGAILVEPPLLSSSGGALSVTLTAGFNDVVVAGATHRTTVYNKMFPAPTLSIAPGDRLAVDVVNNLHEMTNLHTHGLHVSGEGHADNIFVHIQPGNSFDYRYPVPDNHPFGLYWYHPHAHGTGSQQMFGGMAGALIVRGPNVSGLRERIMVLQTTEFDRRGRVVPFPTPTLATNLRLINGQANPTIDIIQGETQLWRFVNASINSVFELSLSGHKFVQVASDGNPYAGSVRRQTVFLTPGQRADLLVRAGAAGTYELKTLAFTSQGGLSTPEAVLATMHSAVGTPPPAPNITPLLEPFDDLRTSTVDRQRTLTFSTLGGFMIDGKTFDPDRVDQTIELGALEEWTIQNVSNVFHPFHIHINPFQVTHINGRPVDVPGYQDTVKVDPQGSVTFRTRFLDYPGRSVFHCHLIPHSDEGMMGVFEVLQANGAQTTRASLPAGVAYCALT
ncbi:MAG: hypothetical protein QOI95_3282 [Acidimicrobiaceae bacterium]|jgi:FtsP/CotA-like multicopper oxidase with cupredoxin domain